MSHVMYPARWDWPAPETMWPRDLVIPFADVNITDFDGAMLDTVGGLAYVSYGMSMNPRWRDYRDPMVGTVSGHDPVGAQYGRKDSWSSKCGFTGLRSESAPHCRAWPRTVRLPPLFLLSPNAASRPADAFGRRGRREGLSKTDAAIATSAGRAPTSTCHRATRPTDSGRSSSCCTARAATATKCTGRTAFDRSRTRAATSTWPPTPRATTTGARRSTRCMVRSRRTAPTIARARPRTWTMRPT